MIKESGNFTGQEAQLAIPYQKSGSLRCYLALTIICFQNTKISIDYNISRDIDDQRTLQSDCLRDTISQTQSKVVGQSCHKKIN